ncbi:hypothetical protein KCU83_g647, partial [Aureobasidium melanogenum]
MHDLDHAATIVPGDIIRQFNDLKAKNILNHEELLERRLNTNNHLFKCDHYNLQVTQYRLVFSGGSPLICTRPDGSINHFNSAKISLAIRLLEFDQKRAASLSAFYAAQKEYFKLIGEMKETEVEIQQLLSSSNKDGQEEDDEMHESRKRFTSLEETRVQMMESWLECADIWRLYLLLTPVPQLQQSAFVLVFIPSFYHFSLTPPPIFARTCVTAFHKASMMDGADNMPQTEGSTTDSLGSSVTTISQELPGANSSLLHFFFTDRFQSKSPEGIAAILKQWQEIEEECAKNIVDVEQLIPKVDRIRLSMLSHLAYYALRIKNLPSTKDLGQLSSEQLQSFHQALDHEQKAGEATWELYNMQKKINASENALEKYIAFREQYFVLEQSEQQHLDQGKNALVIGRFYSRETGLIFGFNTMQERLTKRQDSNHCIKGKQCNTLFARQFRCQASLQFFVHKNAKTVMHKGDRGNPQSKALYEQSMFDNSFSTKINIQRLASTGYPEPFRGSQYEHTTSNQYSLMLSAENLFLNSSIPGIEFVAPEPELSTAQMVQAVKDQYEELSRIGNDTIPLLEAWQHAVYRLATLKQCLEARHPGEPDAKNMDPDNVARLTHVTRIRLLNEMIDELEDLTVKLKVKAWADGDSGAHGLVQDAADRLMRCRGVISKVAEQIVKQPKHISHPAAAASHSDPRSSKRSTNQIITVASSYILQTTQCTISAGVYHTFSAFDHSVHNNLFSKISSLPSCQSFTMTDASSSSENQVQQIYIQLAASSFQVSDDAGSSEQSQLREELKTACTQLLDILNKRHLGEQKTYLRELWRTYRTASFVASYHRREAHAQVQILDLDTATASDISHLGMMSDHEKQAIDAYHAILEIMRADRTIIAETEEASLKILSLADGTPYRELFADMTQDEITGRDPEFKHSCA